MDQNSRPKCVIILQAGLAPGFAANAAAVLALSLGKKRPDLVAEDLTDASGVFHAGLVNVPVPLLQAPAETLKRLRDRAAALANVTLVDFSEPARKARTFEAYRELLAVTPNASLTYLGLALLGPRPDVESLTSGLELLK